MNVHDIGNSQVLEHFRPKRPQGMGSPEEARTRKIAEQPAPKQSGDEGVPGVIRLLQEGHFKGVANVRLHINFYDQLQQVARDAGLAAMESGVRDLTGGLQETVTKALQGLPEDALPDPAVVQELVSGFSGAAEELLDAVRQGQMGFEEALAALGEELDALADRLKGETPAPETFTVQDTQDGSTTVTPSLPAEGVAGDAADAGSADVENPEGAESVAAPLEAGEAPDGNGLALEEENVSPGGPFTLDEAVAKLKEEFAVLLADLESKIAGERYEPVFKTPDNNGRAFSRFLEIYKGLAGESGAKAEAEAPMPALDELI